MKAVKKSSAKPEKHRSDNQVSGLLPNATVEELQNIVCQPAHTSEEKYKVLEAKDRLIRMKQVKSHTLAAAKVMIGTCPDMCPEKERLMRESKRQVALYEQLEGNEYGINHAIAVKQYSRSSADQEEPMAHELRPVSSLKMTMSYLLHEIANLCDQQGTNLGEWYHFLWDRTRGIRKDITQQELCCTDSVQLVEQCARFHIVCSERLCAEEASVFDKRINSDNLTKCLQSLKYMYHDLRVKGVTCKNECEFRAYIILLNLNNGNFMWDLQRLPKSIQKSSEVQFASEVYSALESNNYYKFFKLVRKTTYLNACILLRYFNQVRLKALSIMVKAYCRTASTAYPLYELIDILGFEDESEAIYFCEQIGLNVSKDELHILLNRQNLTMPVLNIKQNRACNLIESKRTLRQLSIGECIAGEKMPEQTYKYHKPHNSFDLDGYLMPSSINTDDQNKSIVPMSIDPYEFKDDDTMETKPLTTVSEEEDQNKTETTAAATYTSIFKSITNPEATVNIFATGETDSSVPLDLKQEAEADETQTSTNEFLKSEIKTETDSKAFSFTPKVYSISNLNKNNESSALGDASNAATTAKTSNMFSKPFASLSNNNVISPFATLPNKNVISPFVSLPNKNVVSPFASLPNKNVTSPFATAPNKNVFSGAAQGNIFKKHLTPSTTFSNTCSNVQTVSKSSNTVNATTFVTSNKLKEIEDLPNYAEQAPKQTTKEVNTEKLKAKEQERVKKMDRINENAADIFNTLQTEVVQSYCSDIVKEAIDRINVCNTLSVDINDEILDEVTHEICDNILKEEILNTQRLYEMSLKIKHRIVLKYFNIWKLNALKKKQQRKILDSTPVWLPKYSSKQCAKLLYSKEQNVVIQNMCKRKTEQEITKSDLDLLAPIEAIIYIGIKENLKLSKINMESNYYWKLVISWPDLHNKPILWYHKKLINQYLCPNDYTMEPIITLYRPNEIETLHICIRHFEGLISDHHLIGSDACLFVASVSEDTKFIIKRLTKTILSRDRLMSIPLVFIVLGDGNFEIQKKEVTASLEKMLKSGYLSAYTIMHQRNLVEATILRATQAAVLWLATNKPAQNPLEMDYLQNIYDTCLTEELWLRIIGDSNFNETLSHALKEPRFIIDLHNEAVTHLVDIILDPESFMYTKFAPELKKFLRNQYMMPCSYEFFDDAWKKEDYKVKLEKVMFSFKLPRWKNPWPITDRSTLHRCITNYCQEALYNSNSNESSYSIVSNLFFTTGVSTMSDFIDVLLYIVKRKVHLLDNDLRVIYNKNHIKHFRTLPWWLKSTLLTEYKITPKKLRTRENEKEKENKTNTNEPVIKRRKMHKLEESDVQLEPLAEFCNESQRQVMDVHSSLKKIEDRLKAHQEQSFLLEQKLKNALSNETKPT